MYINTVVAKSLTKWYIICGLKYYVNQTLTGLVCIFSKHFLETTVNILNTLDSATINAFHS